MMIIFIIIYLLHTCVLQYAKVLVISINSIKNPVSKAFLMLFSKR